MSLSVENKFIVLDKTSTIKVEGDDRVQFLQGQLTQDINTISQNKALYAGFCNPKGRVLAFMLCYLNHESIHIQIDSSVQEFILQKLRMYILRSKVSLNLVNETFTCIGFVGSKALLAKKIQPPKNYLDIIQSDGIMIMCLGIDDDRYQLMGETSKIKDFMKLNFSEYSSMSFDDWNNLNILDGIPEIYPTTQEAFIPQSLNMDLIEGINFKKGCYTGQEIVARTHYLGRVKRRMYRAFIKSQVDLNPGDQILNKNGEEIGQLVRSAKQNGDKTNMLIELRVDQAHDALFIKSNLIEVFLEDQGRFD
ncbi:YgfZ/GcvT domain-containing protein [Candidatus Methylopumilus rimovensis]|uniref:CAF17-like 4Fe-4S cluster assembly/insertion protein YgfZ n=1 Tax=Candidatus Methylopumilus rimovensis TaxID=2588535 RepID=UPI00111D3018|nr:folate-binding protein YgfZ [Candidatus Methylopumilus rimovensis]QDD12318.1 folate-binding protein YgfZ [Candidatus Methylopumilus rimovensis]